MREESKNWWLQALEDLKTARANSEIERYYASVFFSQQAAEKALKSFYIEKERNFPPKTYNMLEISRALKAPEDVFDAVIELNPEYFVTRYPDAANGIPAEMYTEKKAAFHYEKAEMVINWVESQMKLENL